MLGDDSRTRTPEGVFGVELRYYRERAGLSQTELAALVNVSHDVISNLTCDTCGRLEGQRLADLLFHTLGERKLRTNPELQSAHASLYLQVVKTAPPDYVTGWREPAGCRMIT